MTAAPTAGVSVRALHSLAPPDGTTKFVDQMTDGADPRVEVQYFSWKRALLTRYDVLHLHWPELLLRARTGRVRWAKRMSMRALLVKLRLTRTPIVRTLHNVTPHESGPRAERRLLGRVDRATSLFIRLNPTTTLPADASPGTPAVTILHGHYRGVFAAHPRRDAEPGRILYFGIIRRYKNVEGLIDVFAAAARPGRTLRIVGSPSPDMRPVVESAVARHDTVSATLAFVDDDVLVAEITSATLVVLPYTEMHNSGALLVALSLNRPVLVPRTPSNTALADEVGGGWVTQYDGALTARALDAALEAAGTTLAGAPPRLEGRDWTEVGRQHHEAYLTVLPTREGASR